MCAGTIQNNSGRRFRAKSGSSVYYDEIEALFEQALPRRVALDACVVAGGKTVRATAAGVAQQSAEFYRAVANSTRVGRATAVVLVEEILHQHTEFAGEVEDFEVDAEFVYSGSVDEMHEDSPKLALTVGLVTLAVSFGCIGLGMLAARFS